MSSDHVLLSRKEASAGQQRPEAARPLPAYLGLALIGTALLLGVTAWLWWRYGTALFSELAVAALNICF